MSTEGPATLEALAELLAGSTRVVMLTGLRLGGDDGREATGASSDWATRASLEALLTTPSDFWDFYYPHAVEVAGRDPGPGHSAIARLQAAGLVSAVITQAVDRLHRRALPRGANDEVVEVHGSLTLLRCGRCEERYGLHEAQAMIESSPDGIPRCSAPTCGFPLRPAATLWGEPLIAEAVTRAWELAAQADCFVVVDSELRTVPMSLLPSVPLTRGVPLVIVGQTPTQYDRYAQILSREPTVALLQRLADRLAPAGS